MKTNTEFKLIAEIKKGLLSTGIIMMLVAIKLLLSFFLPGLKTPGELVLSGFLLLVYTIKSFVLYSKVKQEMNFGK